MKPSKMETVNKFRKMAIYPTADTPYLYLY